MQIKRDAYLHAFLMDFFWNCGIEKSEYFHPREKFKIFTVPGKTQLGQRGTSPTIIPLHY